MATYVEALDDLTPDELDAGCREATRTAEQFPKPGHIRKGLATASEEGQFLGPRMLTYSDPGLTEGDRDEIIKECRSRLAHLQPAPPKKEKPRIAPRPSTLSIDEQKARLRTKGFLQ